MALVDDISLTMANEAGEAPQIRPASGIAAGMQAGNQVMDYGREVEQEKAAMAFQQVLNQGFQGMQQAYKSMPPELQQKVGDPTFYQKDEEHMASWWAMVAKAQENEAKKTATQGALKQAADGDQKGAIQSLAGAGAMEPGTAIEGMAKADEKTKYDERGKKISGLLGEVQKQTSVEGKVDLNSQLGRQFKITSKRLEPLMPLIDKAAADSGVPANLIKAILSQESAGKPGLTSSAGAKGYMQLMPATAKAMGVKDINNAEQNILGGTKYIGEMLKKYGGDHEKAIAAYNAGPGTVDRAIKKFGDDWKSALPEETIDYLDKVPGYLKAYGGATFDSMGDGTDPKLVDVAKKAADADPELLVDKRYEAIQSAIDKDADNRRSNRTSLQSERLEVQKAGQMQKRVDGLYKRVEGHLNLAKTYQDLDEVIPGGINGTEKIPGIGLGENAIRDLMIGTTNDSKIGKLRSALAELVNVTIQERSGLTVTKDEGKRIMRELGLQWSSTESDFRAALQRKMKNLEKDYTEALKVDPDAMQELLNRDPGKANPFQLKKRGAGNTVTTKSGKTIRVKVSKAD
jgi:soluble lytic murein transglycosylase-like protein